MQSATNEFTRGKTKILFENPIQENTLIQQFLDNVTAFNDPNATKIFHGKGALTSQISAFLNTKCQSCGIPTHFIDTYNDTSHIVKKLKMLPVEVVIRNFSAGQFSKKFAIPEGTILKQPLIEFYLKNDTTGDPQLTEDLLFYFDIVNNESLAKVKALALRTNFFLSGLFAAKGLTFIDCKLEMGFTLDSQELMLGDEISPDCFRIRNFSTGEILDKDAFRKNSSADIIAVYTKLLNYLKN